MVVSFMTMYISAKQGRRQRIVRVKDLKKDVRRWLLGGLFKQSGTAR